MLLGSPPLTALVAWCRALRHGLDVGLSPVRVFRQQARSGPAALRPVADRLADRLETGDSLEDALKPEANRFPLLFVEMIAVGEHAGRLPDVFAELEDYFETVRLTRKDFFRMLAWPLMQYVGAILVVTILLLVLGALGSSLDPLGLGLTGIRGAVVFLAAMTTFTAAVVGTVLVVAGNRELRAKAEGLALTIPGVGGCFQAFALNRFCMAYFMTIEAGLRADRCLKLSLRATANKAYAQEGDPAAKAARRGEEVTSILGGYGERLFPGEFVNALQVGEETGRLAEVMRKQAEYYRDEAKRKLKLLSNIVAGGVYLCIGILLIVMIFKIFTAAYLNPMNDAIRAVDDPQGWMRQR
jgi:type II secretory pathway component PulF